MSSIQDLLSRRVYHARGIETSYAAWRCVPIDEAMALLKYQPAFVDHDVLDLGIGTGRTARLLAPLARRYEGVDFSPAMVDYVHRHLPSISARLGDIRDLSEFEEGSFDFVFASNNVISAVGHEDRLRVLSEVGRVLRVKGVFTLSCHNRNYERAGYGPRLRLSRNPITLLHNAVSYVRSMITYLRVRKHRMSCADYDLLNDVGHDFALLHYYLDRQTAERQLVGAGFRLLDVFSPSGKCLSDDDHDEDAPFLLYVAEKSAA